jgi:hypothetical protein
MDPTTIAAIAANPVPAGCALLVFVRCRHTVRSVSRRTALPDGGVCPLVEGITLNALRNFLWGRFCPMMGRERGDSLPAGGFAVTVGGALPWS